MKKVIISFFVVFGIPILIISFFYSYKIKKNSIGYVKNKKEEKESITMIRVLRDNNEIETMNIEEYLIGVLAAEVPVSFEKEALKAQAVASRTYALKQIQNNSEKEYDVTDNVLTQVYYSDDILRNRWQDSYDSNILKIRNAISSTKGEYLSYDGDIIYAFFFSTSNGMTEDNKNVFGADLDYLKPVDSSFDESETDIISITTYSKEDFYSKLNLEYNNEIIISDINKSTSGRTLFLSVNGNPFKGREFQKLLGLRSNDFTIEVNGEEIDITTKGYGHGVGMSQYGANALAKQNKNYMDILKYYYTGVELKKL